jgi:peptidoglycan/LPS O-acetylase OafA/YrhL
MLGIDYDKRIYGLDILRAFAIVTVVYNHGWVYSQTFAARHTYDFFHFDGVTLFFVLSGFLIGGIAFRMIEKQGATLGSLQEFWKRRWFRTFPMYFLILSFLAVQFVANNGYSSFISIAKYFLFLQNLFSYREAFFSESWSLAVEEWFYIVFPLLLWSLVALLKWPMRKSILSIILLFIVGSLSMRFLKYYIQVDSDLAAVAKAGLQDRFPFTVVCRLDSLMYGILAAFLFFYKRTLWESARNRFMITGVAIVLSDYLLNMACSRIQGGDFFRFALIYRYVIHYSVLPLSLAMTLPWFNSIRSSTSSFSRLVIIISTVSYSMYLLHISVIMNLQLPEMVGRLFPAMAEPIASYSLYWVMTIVLACCSYKFFEKPMTDLREKVHIKKQLAKLFV